MDKLLPCPFCGSPAMVIERNGEYPDSSNVYHAACVNCGIMDGSSYSSKSKAVTVWNTRQPQQHVAVDENPTFVLSGAQDAKFYHVMYAMHDVINGFRYELAIEDRTPKLIKKEDSRPTLDYTLPLEDGDETTIPTATPLEQAVKQLTEARALMAAASVNLKIETMEYAMRMARRLDSDITYLIDEIAQYCKHTADAGLHNTANGDGHG